MKFFVSLLKNDEPFHKKNLGWQPSHCSAEGYVSHQINVTDGMFGGTGPLARLSPFSVM